VEFAHTSQLPFPVIAARMLFAAILGAAIGFEREWRNRPAGLRTHVLICIAAATFGILAIEIVHASVFQAPSVSEQVNVDPLRVIEAVTAGVAFLAAGTIILARGEVHGLTTGAGHVACGRRGSCVRCRLLEGRLSGNNSGGGRPGGSLFDRTQVRIEQRQSRGGRCRPHVGGHEAVIRAPIPQYSRAGLSSKAAEARKPR
jgi:hypothetical protein